MAIEVACIPSSRIRIPMCILPMVIRIEGESFITETQELIECIGKLYNDVYDLHGRVDKICESLIRLQTQVDGINSDIQPIWDDEYNLCGDPHCDGWCTVCRDGEYLGEDDYEEKYCRRGKR